jgi:hypothetical protein
MPDRDKEALQSRNKDTLLTVRVPAGLKPRVTDAAKRASITVSAFVVAAIEDKLQGSDGGKTAPAGNRKGGTTVRKPRTRPAPPAATFQPAEPEGALDIIAALRRSRTGDQL